MGDIMSYAVVEEAYSGDILWQSTTFETKREAREEAKACQDRDDRLYDTAVYPDPYAPAYRVCEV